MRTLEEPALDSRTRLTPARLGLLAGACLIAPGVRFYQAIGDPDRLVLIVASAVLFLLVVSRMAGLVRQEERTTARELALRDRGRRARRGRRRRTGQRGSHLRRPRARRRRGSRSPRAPARRRRRRRRVLRVGRRMGAVEGDEAWLRESAEGTEQVALTSLPEEIRASSGSSSADGCSCCRSRRATRAAESSFCLPRTRCRASSSTPSCRSPRRCRLPSRAPRWPRTCTDARARRASDRWSPTRATSSPCSTRKGR